MTKILAFSGKKQSGKTTCANFILAMFLSDSNRLFDSVTINTSGLLEVVKADTKETVVIDPPRYYQQSDNLDPTVFNTILELTPHIKIYSFADPLKKNICIDILGLTYEQCYGTDEEKNQITHIMQDGKLLTGREVMQYVGTDIFREMLPDVWPLAAIRNIKKDNPKLAIITDCRFPNEVEAVQKAGGKVIRLTRNVTGHSQHISENILNEDIFDWNKFDYILDNTNIDVPEQCNKVHSILLKELQ